MLYGKINIDFLIIVGCLKYKGPTFSELLVLWSLCLMCPGRTSQQYSNVHRARLETIYNF